MIDFARDILGTPLDPWEELAVIRAGELRPDGRPRFRKVLIIVARQNGKTYLLRVLTLYWLFVECWAMVFGISTTSAMAGKQWATVVRMAQTNKALKDDIYRVNRSKASESLETVDGAEYCFGASNENAGRSLSIDRLIIDELRHHKTWLAWNAAYNAMNARPEAQAFCITNQGDLRAVVLRSLRADALKAIETGDDSGDVCLLEWSAPDGASPLDVHALAAANPNMNRVGADGLLRIDQSTLLGEARRVLLAGGDELTTFRIEVMCQEQSALDGAVDPVAWREGNRDAFPQLRSRLALFLDVAPTGRHATLTYAAVQVDDKIRIEVVQAWEGKDAVARLRAELPALVKRLRPQKLGWLPGGPSAALGAYMAKLPVPAGCLVEEVTDEVSAVCMGFAERVLAGEVVHQDDPLLEAHVTGASKLKNGDRWRFTRSGEGDCDAAYAAAGAVHLALTLPKPIGKPRILTVVE